MNTTINGINGAAFEEKRKELNLSREDLGKSVCLSSNQIKHIETGEETSFYTFPQKIRAAQRVADRLQLPENISFTYEVIKEPDEPTPEVTSKANLADNLESKSIEAVLTIQKYKFFKPILLIVALLLLAAAAIFKYGPSNADFFVGKSGSQKLADSSSKIEPETITPNQQSPAVIADICTILVPDAITEIQAKNPQYVGDSISIKADKDMEICIVDESSERRKYQLVENAKKVIPVRSKFAILGDDLTHLTIYFQGERMQANSNFKSALSIKENRAYPKKCKNNSEWLTDC